MGLRRSVLCEYVPELRPECSPGLIVSDWTGVYSTSESIKAGLDLEMPWVMFQLGVILRAHRFLPCCSVAHLLCEAEL